MLYLITFKSLFFYLSQFLSRRGGRKLWQSFRKTLLDINFSNHTLRLISKGQASQHQNCLRDTCTLHCKDTVNTFLQLHSNWEPKTVDSIQFTATTVPTLNVLRIPNLNVTDQVSVPWMLLTKLLCLNLTSVHHYVFFFQGWVDLSGMVPLNLSIFLLKSTTFIYLFNQCTHLPDAVPRNF